jgi:hypothetical protein
MRVNNESKRIWKEAIMVQILRYHPSICLEGLIKTMKNLRITSLCAEI